MHSQLLLPGLLRSAAQRTGKAASKYTHYMQKRETDIIGSQAQAQAGLCSKLLSMQRAGTKKRG